MSEPKSSARVSVRVPAEILERVAQIRAELPIDIGTSGILRAAITLGLDRLEAERRAG